MTRKSMNSMMTLRFLKEINHTEALLSVHTTGIYTEVENFATKNLRGPAWLSGKVFDSYSRGPGFEPHRIL